jgi:hypothetical protein
MSHYRESCISRFLLLYGLVGAMATCAEVSTGSVETPTAKHGPGLYLYIWSPVYTEDYYYYYYILFIDRTVIPYCATSLQARAPSCASWCNLLLSTCFLAQNKPGICVWLQQPSPQPDNESDANAYHKRLSNLGTGCSPAKRMPSNSTTVVVCSYSL